MKNKKLFAILTLVCFMFTLMPVAAFAADPDAAEMDSDAYVVAQDVKGTFKESANVHVGKAFKAAVDIDGTTSGAYYFYVTETNGDVVKVSETDTIKLNTEGRYYVYAVNVGADTTEIVTDNKLTAEEKVGYLEENCADAICDDYAVVKVSTAEDSYEITLETFAGDVTVAESEDDDFDYEITGLKADAGWDDTKYTAVLKTVGGDKVKEAELEFTTNSGYLDVELLASETDRRGEVEFKLSATKAGNYKLTVSYGDEDVYVKVVVGETEVANVNVIAQPKTPAALDTGIKGYTGIAFELTDGNGTVLKDGADLSDVKVSVVEAPADSAIVDEDDLRLDWDAEENEAWILDDLDGTASLDEEGTYTFKVTLKNGASAKATVNVKEFDKPVSMMITLEQDTIEADNGVAKVKRIVLLDKNYVAKAIFAKGMKLNNTPFEVVANGKALDSVTESEDAFSYMDPGTITVKTKADSELDVEKQVGTTITVMAICEKYDLTATAELQVVNSVAAIEYVDTAAEVAVNNVLDVIAVDEDGNKVEKDFTGADVKVYVINAPANAVYSAAGEVVDGDIEVEFTASAKGEYKLQTVVTMGTTYLSSVDTITVGGAEGTFKDVVVMSIGSANIVVNSNVTAIDAAPMIQDGRTFVPFRALAETFGATVSYDEATQSVTAELNGVKVVMTIGSNEYTVDGVAKTADVAPFINGSRTMVPVRFVAEAFGITVTPLYAEDGTVADVLFAK